MMQPRPPAPKRSSSTRSMPSSSAKLGVVSQIGNASSKSLGASAATLKKSERQTRRDQKQQDEAVAVAATSAALLDSVVPSKLIDSAAAFVLSTAPRIFAFQNRHITSIRHPFFTMLSSESSSEHNHTENNGDENNNNNNDNTNGNGENNDANHHNNNKRSSSSKTGRAIVTRKDGGLNRGGTNNVSTAHVSAVDNALKARRRSFQTLAEYLVERFSDISSGYPIEMERWKQTAYMFDSVLLEDDLVRRRRDILENVHVVRALEACWTSWGGTTSSGIDFATYKEEHLRLFRTLMGVDTPFDQSFMVTVFGPSIDKDWNTDKEVAASSSSVRKMNASFSNNNNNSPSRLTNRSENSTSPTNRNTNSRDSARVTGAVGGNASFHSASGVLGRVASSNKIGGTVDDVNKFQVFHEVPFRKFCVAMLELADNWTRLRIGEQAAHVFAKFLLKVVHSPNNNERSKKQRELQLEQQRAAKEERRKQMLLEDNEDDGDDDNDETKENLNLVRPAAVAAVATPLTTSSITPSMAYASLLLEKEKQNKKTATNKNSSSPSKLGIGGRNAANSLGGNFEVLHRDSENNSPSANREFNDDENIDTENNKNNNNTSRTNKNEKQRQQQKDEKRDEVESEWKSICQTLKQRAFMHRGGPVIRMIPPECPGVPATYSALPKTKDEKFEEDDEEAAAAIH